MGIDIVAGGRNVNGKRRDAPASDNVYQKLLVKLSVAVCVVTNPRSTNE